MTLHFPLTFLLKSKDNLMNFNYYFQKNVGKNQNIWILKPGENTNRGNGIIITNDINEIQKVVSELKKNRTLIIQKYIENPLLINNRKFDIRCYVLISNINSHLKGISQ